jgi:hypothetical protein
MDNINNILGIIGGIFAGVLSVASFASTYYRRNCSDDLDNVINPVTVVDINDIVLEKQDSYTTITIENHHKVD